jgi:hypothetical protein
MKEGRKKREEGREPFPTFRPYCIVESVRYFIFAFTFWGNKEAARRTEQQ